MGTMTHSELKIDWINLPPHTVPQSLWTCLHDGELLTIHSDLLERTVSLEIDVPHLRQHHQLTDDQRFIFQLQDVESARVSTWAVWPGAIPEAQDKSYEEQNRLVKEYQTKWREESMTWNNFVAAFATNEFDIGDAQVARNESSVAMQIQGSLYGDEFDNQFFNVFMRAKQILIQQNNGATVTVEHLTQLGDDYWNSFETNG